MAGGKQSPRQKMINLMYLVFLAMMAMNMGKEVLAAFGTMNEKLTEANSRATTTNAAAYENLATKAAEQAKQYGPAKEKTDVLKSEAEKLYNFIEKLKSEMVADVEDPKDYQVMDKSGFLDSYFFESGSISAKGKDFVQRIEAFKKAALIAVDSTNLVSVVNSRFNTDAVTNREDLKVNWLNYNYEGFPLIASLTKLTQIQADVKATESEALSTLLKGELESAVSMTNYDAMVVFDKNAYYPGEKLSGRIVLGKNDPNLTAEKVVINGKDWPEDKIKAGQVILDGPAGNVGDRDIKGSFFFKENDSLVEIPIKGGYSVIPRPNEAVISADKMNAVYRGLSNPMTISMPGVPSNKVSASAPGLRKKSGDSYVMTPGKGSEVTIRVTGVLPGGNKVSSNKKFRIKDIPPAVGAVRGQYGTVSMPKGSVGNVTVGAMLPDFLFDLKLKVSSFKIKVPGQPAVPVTGTRMSSRAKKAISKARRGEVINIFDIKATVSGSGAPVKKVVGVGIKVSN